MNQGVNAQQLAIDWATKLERVHTLAKLREHGELPGDFGVVFFACQPIEQREREIVRRRLDGHGLQCVAECEEAMESAKIPPSSFLTVSHSDAIAVLRSAQRS